MPTRKLTDQIINAAIDGFQVQKTRIDQQILELRALLSGGSTETVAIPEVPTRKRKKFSAKTRRKMAEAQRLRYAKMRSESEPPALATPEKPKHRISAEGMKRILAANKKRWAMKRAEAKKAQSPVAKKSAPKKPAKKAAPAKAAKKTATAAAQAVTEAGAQ